MRVKMFFAIVATMVLAGCEQESPEMAAVQEPGGVSLSVIREMVSQECSSRSLVSRSVNVRCTGDNRWEGSVDAGSDEKLLRFPVIVYRLREGFEVRLGRPQFL